MRDDNGTEIARGNSTVSYTVSDTTEDDFGMFNCTAESPDGKAEYLVELRKAGTHGKELGNSFQWFVCILVQKTLIKKYVNEVCWKDGKRLKKVFSLSISITQLL